METRLAPRINVAIKATSKIDESCGSDFYLSGGNVFEAKVFDISRMGLGILVKVFLPSGLTLDIDMDGAAFGLKRNISIKGEIRYCKMQKVGEYKCGIRFSGISEEDRDVIGSFVSKYEKRTESREKLSDQ